MKLCALKDRALTLSVRGSIDIGPKPGDADVRAREST